MNDTYPLNPLLGSPSSPVDCFTLNGIISQAAYPYDSIVRIMRMAEQRGKPSEPILKHPSSRPLGRRVHRERPISKLAVNTRKILTFLRSFTRQLGHSLRILLKVLKAVDVLRTLSKVRRL